MKFSVKKIFYNDSFLKLFSIIAAVIFWFIVVANVYPDYDRTISNIAITGKANAASGINTSLTESNSSDSSGYSIISLSQENVKIKVSGPRYIIGKLTASDFIITPKNVSVNSAGSRAVRLEAKLVNPDSDVEIDQIIPSSVSIFYDKVVSKEVPVTVDTSKTSVADSYEISDTISDPASITVSGPETVVSQINSAVASVNAGSNITQSVTKNADIVLYDGSNKKIDTQYLKMDKDKANVTISVLKTKDVPLTVLFTNMPSGFSTDNLDYSISPSSVKLAGASDVIDSLSSICLSDIEFTKLGLTDTFEYKIAIPDGTSGLENYSTATVSVNLKNTGTKKVSVNKISVTNVPSGYKVKIVTKKISNVLLFGPSDSINSVSGIQAVADLSSVNIKTGTMNVAVKISVHDKSEYWTNKVYKIKIYVTKS